MDRRGAEPLGVVFGERVTYRHFEEMLSRFFRDSLNCDEVLFDLTATSWIGRFPAELLFTWILTLAKKRRKAAHVELRTRDLLALPAVVRSVLVDSGLLWLMEQAGVRVPFSSFSDSRRGLPFTVIEGEGELRPALEYGAAKLEHDGNFGRSARDIIDEAFRVISFELAENAFLHTRGSRPQYQVSISASASRRFASQVSEPSGVMAVFERSRFYVEVVLGDLGPGIDATLKSHVPDDFEPRFSLNRPLNNSERAIAFAFDFFSTSNQAARAKRISDLVKGAAPNPSDVATGLFLVYEVARTRKGQLLVRTPTALLSVDFTQSDKAPRVRGARELGIGRLARLPGTHFLLRLPITEAESERAPIRPSLEQPETEERFAVLSAFPSSVITPDDVALNEALSALKVHFRKAANRTGFTFIMPARQRLSSRAEAVFVAALRAFASEEGPIVWLQQSAITSVREIGRASPYAAGRSGAPVFVGDLLTNEFVMGSGLVERVPRGFRVVDSLNRLFKLEEPLRKRVDLQVDDETHAILSSQITSPEVRHAPGPFLIEGQYYTETFFEIAAALKHPGDIELFAEWFARRLGQDPPPEVIIAVAPTVNKLLPALQDVLRRVNGKAPLAIECVNPTATWLMTQLLPHTRKQVIIVTDVIARGHTLQKLLALVPEAPISRILTFVDARLSGASGKRVWLEHVREGIPVTALVTEPIEGHEEPTHPELAADDPSTDGEERVFVIDPRTHAPTLYVRPIRAQLSIKDLLAFAIPRSHALVCGHSELHGRHYDYFLDFPRLFEGLRSELQDWIRTQVAHVSRASSAGSAKWHAGVFDPDGSLSWLKQYLPSLPEAITVQTVTREDLFAPPAPVTSVRPRGNWLVVVPAIASGSTTRRCIEYASRYRPRTILMLAVAARMDTAELTFFTKVSKYGDAALRIARYLDFPIPAYDPGPQRCPSCAAQADFADLLAKSRDELGTESDLTKALIQKVAASAAIPLDTESLAGGTLSLPSANDLGRTRIRSLYASAAFDLGARRSLNRALANKDNQELMLQIVAIERKSPEFSLVNLRRRLYKVEPDLVLRCHDVLNASSPPYPIGRVVGALIHLTPTAFIERAGDLVLRYSTSRRDVEELCFGMLLTRSVPPNAGSIIEALSRRDSNDVAKLLTNTCELIRLLASPGRAHSEKAQLAICKLWAELFRTSRYAMAIDQLVLLTADASIPWAELKQRMSQACHYWDETGALLVAQVERSALWRRLSGGRIKVARFAPLQLHIAQLSRLAVVDENSDGTPDLRQDALSLSARIQQLNLEIGEAIDSYFINPLHCIAAELPDEIVGRDGLPISVVKDIDYHVGKTLCNLHDLNDVCSELIENWKKYASGSDGREVRFRLHSADAYVVFEFADTFDGEIRPNSAGGLKSIAEFCEDYGATLEIVARDLTGFKSVRIQLSQVPAIFVGGNRQFSAKSIS